VNLDQVDVEVPVPERYFSRVKLGMTARVTAAALPDWSEEKPVTSRVPSADVRSRTFRVKVRLENEEGPDGQRLLSAGMFAQVTLPVGPQEKALLVPKDAVVSGGEYPVLYAVDVLPSTETGQPGKPGGPGQGAPGGPPAGPPPDGLARWVPVELGAAKGRLIEVRVRDSRLLSGGDLVVVEGNERLFPRCPVAIINRDQLGE
jgi:multidrug efflux pump subunit AcrA (membrane-fusion protein)